MRDLSVIIPARCEMFLKRTIEDILENMEADTEIIAICDGNWPEPSVQDHSRVTIVHHTESIGQRAATNEGARISQAKFVMKADAHFAFDKGFDAKLMADCEKDWTIIPWLRKLHAFDWKCKNCGNQTYQSDLPIQCEKCQHQEFEMVTIWKPKKGGTYSWRFDNALNFQYWRKHSKRPEWENKDLIETMSFIGACFLMHRERFLELGGCDEAHGSWGNYGTEIALKAWLSGGKLIASRKTWAGHFFRTGNMKKHRGGSCFPYPLSGKAQEYAKQYSRDFWFNNRLPNQKHNLAWIVNRFWPVKGWTEKDKAQLGEIW